MRLRLAPVGCLFFLACQSVFGHPGETGTGSAVRSTAAFYVGGTAASDSNPGSESKPLKSIARALVLATDSNIKGIDSTVLVRNGMYRERMDLLPVAGLTDASITIKAVETGRATISGSDLWNSNWQPSVVKDVYVHPWPFTWGLVPYPAGWEGSVVVPDLLRRRELISVNGSLLKQVLTEAELVPGSFFVSESAKTVEVCLLNGVSPSKASFEVGVRSNLLYVDGRHNIRIQGLIFEHDASGLEQGSALSIINSENVVLSECKLYQNGITGLRLFTSQAVQINNTVANQNGFQGVSAWKLANSSFSNSETSNNNWRGSGAGFLEWAAGGAKLMLLRNVKIENHRALNNQTFGLWFDTDCKDVAVENSMFEDNLLDGIFLEANEGPLSLNGNLICRNRNGALFATSQNATLVNNIVYDNREAQVMISGQPGGREILDQDTGASIQVLSRNVRVSGNAFARQSGAALVLTTLPESDWLTFVDSTVFDSNTYSGPKDGAPEFAGNNGSLLTFPEWQNAYNQDVNSTWSNTVVQ